MEEKPTERLLRESLGGDLKKNLELIRSLYSIPRNQDPILRPFVCGQTACALCYLQGMASEQLIDQFILQPLQQTDRPLGESPLEEIKGRLLTVGEAEESDSLRELNQGMLDGKTLLLVEGCPQGLLLATQGYPQRSVERTCSESVVLGPQEGFVENLRTNITLVRRIVRSEALIGEMLTVGTRLPTHLSLLYLDGVARMELVEEMKRRLMAVDSPFCPGTGELMQRIEDNPHSLLPQILETERPDRAARALCDGQLVLLVDGSPYALIAPITVFHLLHAPDDTFMRWQYGSFVRIIRLIGLLLSLLLPGMYVALTLFHPHMIPMGLLTSIAETRADVPFPILVEVLIMEGSFYLINEASTRIPSLIGPTIGIVGALILGQAAVSASIISPILIIVVALTGLGNYAVPNYGMSIGLQIIRLAFIVAGALMGVYGLVLSSSAALCYLASMRSLGEPFLAPLAPWRPHNPDLLLRLPLWMQRRALFLARRAQWVYPAQPHRSK